MEAKGLAIAQFSREILKALTARARLSQWRIAIEIAFVFMSALVFAASELDVKPEKTEIVIALPQPSGAPIPIFLAHEAGLFKKYGLNAKIQILNSAVSVQAIVSGDADIFAGGATMSNARLRGAPFKFRRYNSTICVSNVRRERNHQRATTQGKDSRGHNPPGGHRNCYSGGAKESRA